MAGLLFTLAASKAILRWFGRCRLLLASGAEVNATVYMARLAALYFGSEHGYGSLVDHLYQKRPFRMRSTASCFGRFLPGQQPLETISS